MRRAIASIVLLSACTATPSTPVVAGDLTLDFETDAAIDVGSEQYLCYVYDRGALAGSPLQSITWGVPSGPNVVVHHISLYALTEAPGAGKIDCASERWGVGPRFSSYTAGQTVTTMPGGVSLELPDATRWIGAEVHVLRMGTGTSPPGKIVLHPPASTPEHLALWMETDVPIPELLPRSEQSSTRRCTVDHEIHIVAAWPHMHRMGRFFDSKLIRKNGDTSTFLRVEPWDFTHQFLYPEDVVLNPGDSVDLTCDWQNTSDQTITNGLYASNEMCSFAFIAWPAEDAHCTD